MVKACLRRLLLLTLNTRPIHDTSIEKSAGESPALSIRLCLTCDGRYVSLHPLALREVREIDRRTATAHGTHTERSHGRPGSGIIHIHIRRKTLAHALQQPVEHDEVHTAMPAQLCRELALFPPQRMRILLPRLDRHIRLVLVLAVKVNAWWVVLKDAF